MHPRNPGEAGFKRQVVFRIGPDDWPLLQAAAHKHGSIQAAVLAGIRALAQDAPDALAAETTSPPAPEQAEPVPLPRKKPPQQPAAVMDPGEEIPAREAARILGLKSSTVSGYIRSGRLPGRYDGEPTWHGWFTTRAAVDAYRAKHPRL